MELDFATWIMEFHSGIPVYKQIMHHVQAAVAEGRLGEGDQLPTVRALHRQLKVNPNTVARAYRELEHLGVISTERGSGCFVAPAPAAARLSAKEKAARLSQLCARVAAEARSHGLQLEDVIRHINKRKSHV